MVGWCDKAISGSPVACPFLGPTQQPLTVPSDLWVQLTIARTVDCVTLMWCCSLSECYFAGGGAALVLPPNERVPPWPGGRQSAGCDIQQHLQSMFYLLRPEETLKMVSQFAWYFYLTV